MNTSLVTRESLLQQLQWRYATKKFDIARKISTADWQALEEAMVLTPSSFGLQPYRMVVVSSLDVRERLVPHAWGQRQIADASHLVVFGVLKEIHPAYVERYLERVAEVRGVERATLEPYRKMMLNSLFETPLASDLSHWAALQAYIAVGNLMTAAALMGIDTCPIEGFEPNKFDEILGLAEHGLASVVCCVLGYRAADDRYAKAAKVRWPASEMFVRM